VKRLCTLILAVFLSSAALLCCGSGLQRVDVVIGGQTFTVEVARSEEQQREGLMNRDSLGWREGMIFVYDSDQHLAFWMKNTTLELTILFLSKTGEILQIEELKPLSLKPVVSERAARYAVELARGSLEELGVKPGDEVVLPEDFP